MSILITIQDVTPILPSARHVEVNIANRIKRIDDVCAILFCMVFFLLKVILLTGAWKYCNQILINPENANQRRG